MGARETDRLRGQALRHHRGGRAAEAERCYRAVLVLAPGDAESLHGLGCLAHEAGRPEVAIGLIGQAVAAAPERAYYLISLGLALLERNHVEEARAALHVATLRDAADPRAHRALGQALSRQGRLAEAEASLRTALALDPASAACLLALGGVLRARGDLVGAVAAFDAASRRAPGDALAWHALASAQASLGALLPAEAAFRRAAALLPGDAAAQANLGTALFGLDRLEEARATLLRAQALAPDNAATLSSLGLVRMGLGETLEAERVLARASGLAPSSHAIAVNHGTALAALERRDEAEARFRAVLAADPSDAQARFNLGTMLLARGALAEGWAAFEARLALAGRGVAASAQPAWDGAALEAGRVLIRAEQGLGDTIQFLRWVAPAAGRAKLALELPPSLIRLVADAGLFEPARVRLLATGEPAPEDCVAEASLLSLPHVLGLAVPPAMTMRADAAAICSWQARLPPGFRVGLAWAGSASYRFDRARSVTLAQLAPLAGVAGVQFVCLQQGPAAAQALTPPVGMALFVPEAPFADLAETAALIGALDLVISVDTVIAHLAGALGKPVWLLDRFGGDWRWGGGLARGAVWYPALRRFTQREPTSSWAEAVVLLADTIRAWSSALNVRPRTC